MRADQVRTGRFSAIVGALASLLPSSAFAESYFVSPSGNDNDTGLAGSPWRQPQEACDHVGPGDTVTLADGTYDEIACEGVSGTSGSPIVFRAENRWGAHIASQSGANDVPGVDAVSFIACSYIVIDGLQVSGASRAGILIGGLEPDGSDARGVVVRNNWSHDNGSTPNGRHDGIFTGFALDVIVEYNLVHDITEHGIYVSNSADNPIIRYNRVYATGRNCIQINADDGTAPGDDGEITNWVIEGNVMNDCNGSFALNLDGVANGVARNNVLYGAPNSGGITFFQGDGASASHDNVAVNNTIFNPSCDNPALQIANGANDNVAFNNIFICSAGESGIELQSATGFVHDHNIVSGYDGLSASANETTLTPSAALALFVSATDLHLVAGSDAIDEGVASYGGASAPGHDAENHPRPQESGFDLGAYEHGDMGPMDGGTAPSNDGGTGAPDGSTGTPDGGTRDGGGGGGGGGRCDVGHGTAQGSALFAFFAMACALLTRRRARCAQGSSSSRKRRRPSLSMC